MSCSFKFNHYHVFLTKAIAKKYGFRTFTNYTGIEKRTIILRHDIDFRPDKALEIAQIEAELDIIATYFVRVHAKEYNPFEYKTYNILMQLLEWGHEIGLHTEALDMVQTFGGTIHDRFMAEMIALETILDRDIEVAVPHGDFGGTIAEQRLNFFKDYRKQVPINYHPFEDRFFKDMKFISDTFGIWREKCPCQFLGKVDKMQISTHPIYWFREFYHL